MDIEELMETIAENAACAFDKFKAHMLTKTKEEIFNSNYQIQFYVELHFFFTECGTEGLEDHTLAVLAGFGDSILSTLFEVFINNEFASINSWGDICEWLDLYAKQMVVRQLPERSC